jgi:hypothetical protein
LLCWGGGVCGVGVGGGVVVELGEGREVCEAREKKVG